LRPEISPPIERVYHMNAKSGDIYVTRDECANRLHIPRWVFVTACSVVVGMLGIVVLMLQITNDASAGVIENGRIAAEKAEKVAQKAERVAYSLDTHVAVREVENKAILDKLDQIYKVLEKQEARDEKHDEIIQTILGEILVLKTAANSTE